MDKQLTPKQLECLRHIAVFVSDNGYPPTLREINTLMGTTNAMTAHEHVTNLAVKGCLKWTEGKRRTIRLTDKGVRAVDCERCFGRGWVQEFVLKDQVDPSLGVWSDDDLSRPFMGQERVARCTDCKSATPQPASRVGLSVVKVGGFSE